MGELLYVVDEDDRPLEPQPRKLVHGNGAWHRVAHIWIVNARGEILCQQRSMSKDLNPGMWTASFGGHMMPGEEYRAAGVRELEEELGLRIHPDDLEFWKVYRSARHPNNEFQGIFVLKWDGGVKDVRFNDGEVEQVSWMPAQQVAHKVLAGADDWVHIG
jgi:isopentenyldiphosphate isomerase